MATAASWYHCSVKPVSRSAGRSVVAAAAYRLGESLHDERYAVTHDYTRRSGVENTFTVAPLDAPAWAFTPERLWNEAERAETRSNSRVAREVELALPALLSPDERQRITERFAGELVERYGVAVSVAVHAPGKGDDRNYHAHILFTTREMTPDGLGKKTRVLDARDTGPAEVMKLRELAADLINESLTVANADIRVDHRSFEARGIEREPTTHLGPAAASMERRGEATERGDLNRQAEQTNVLLAERDALDTAIAHEEERISAPPATAKDARERIQDETASLKEAIRARGSVADIQSSSDGLKWWQRIAVRIAESARDFIAVMADRGRELWQRREQNRQDGRERDDGGRER
jgi:MobA/MobL family